MENKILLKTALLLILSSILGACGFQTPPTTVEPTPIIPAHSPSPEPFIAYRELAEEDLAIFIRKTAVTVKNAATEFSRVTKAATSDDHVTDEEIAEILTNLQTLQSESRFAQELIDIYADQYGELADETMDLLLSIDENLEKISTSSNEMVTNLGEANNSTSIGIEQLGIVLESIENQSATVHEQTGIWLADVQAQIESREKFYANTQPQLGLVAYNRIDAFTQAHDFVDKFTAALSDKKLSPAELAEISKLAATAKSSLYNTGDPQLFTFAQQINDLSRHASRGEWTQASSGLVELEFAMPARPRP